jgi:hypothetical protein
MKAVFWEGTAMQNFKTSNIMENVAKLKHKPVRLSGYLGQASSDDAVHLYPEIDPGRYFVIPKTCIIDVLAVEGDKNERMTVLVDATCEVECIVREHKRAEVYLAGGAKPCGCTPPSPGTGTIGRSLDEHFIALAKLLVSLGIDKFDCNTFGRGGSMPAGCCAAWNRLLSDIASGGNGIFAAEYLVAACTAG